MAAASSCKKFVKGHEYPQPDAFSSDVLTYTPGYGYELKDIKINKVYNIEYINDCYEDETTKDYINFHSNSKENLKFMIKWTPEEGETHIDINKNITIIDYLLVKDNCGENQRMYILDNYGNKYSSHAGGNGYGEESYSNFYENILLQKDMNVLSDQVIDYIKQNNLIYKLNSEQIKEIQKLADMGKEKTIKYVMEYPQSIIEVAYDKNNIIKELNIAFPTCDPWEKAKELFNKYSSMVNALTEEYEKDTELMTYFIGEKNNIEKLIRRNKDIDDKDIKELIEIKSSRLKGFESQIEGLLESNEVKKNKINKLNLLLCKLDPTNIPEKILTTEFI